jgi:ribose-phosphate pyrophosphokinase
MVTAVMPYLIYARQDKDFLSDKDEFEPISIEILLENLAAYAKELVTFNAHFERKEKVITKYALPIYNIDAFKVLEDSLDNISDLVIIAPDKGMRDFSKDLAQSHNAGFDYLNKKRDKVTREITFLPKDFDIAGKNVVIPDDIASTCGTLIKSIEHLKQYEPKDIYAMFVHGAFTEGAQDNLEKACNNIIFTNTINNPKATVHVEEYLAEYLRSNVIHNKKQWVPEA